MNETTGEMRQSDTLVTVNGLYNGKPHSITYDVADVLAEQAQLRGDTVSQEELHTQAMLIIDDIERVRQAKEFEEPKTLRAIAADFLSKFVPV